MLGDEEQVADVYESAGIVTPEEAQAMRGKARTSIEDRLAALEALVNPVAVAPEWTDEQVAEFRRAWEAMTPDAMLRECVTVVKPGETLVIRTPGWWTPDNVHEYQRWLNVMAEGRFAVLAVAGEEFAVITQDATVSEVRTAAGLPPADLPLLSDPPGSGTRSCRCSVTPAG